MFMATACSGLKIMLQFNATLCAAIVKTIPKSSWRIPRLLSSATNPHEQVANSEKCAAKTSDEGNNESEKAESSANPADSNPSHGATKKPLLTSAELSKAKSADDFLNIVQNYHLSKQDTFKIMSGMMHLINGGQIKIEDMLMDKRFERLQQSIAAMDTGSYNKQRADLAVKYGSLSTVEMIKVLGGMVKAGEKNIDVMRYLTDQIIQYNAQLSPDNCKQLLSYMVSMNFQHKVLTNKICRQLVTNSSQLSLDTVQQVVTSLGFLKYKDNLLFDVMCTYMLYHKGTIPPNDLSSVLLTFATLGYCTPKVESLIKKHIHPLNCTDFTNSIKWFHLVWSLAVLNMAEKQHYESVLSSEFVESLSKLGKLTVPNRIKLLTLKAAANIDSGLDGIDLLGIGDISKSLKPSRYRQVLVQALHETLKVTMPSESHFKMSVNTGMGFFIDAECYANAEGNFETEGSSDVRNRIAVVLLSLAEYTRGEGDLVGLVNFHERLLKANGYTVVRISEKYFSPVDTAPKRIMYVKDEIRKAINLPK